MMCPEMDVRLNEYVDGTLTPAPQAAVEAHLAGCAGCREAVADLRRLATGARGLSRTLDAPRDLWPGIEARIGPRAAGRGRRIWWRERVFWAGALAAAAAFVIALGVYRATVRAPGRQAGQGWEAVEADYDAAARELSGILAAQRGRLRPETVALVERNLAIVDAAITEARTALERDPGNPELRCLVAAASRQKVELLRWAARDAAS